MIDLSGQFLGSLGTTRPWIVCESGDRWLTAVRRFAPQLMPPPWVPAVTATEGAKVREILSSLHVLPALHRPSSGRGSAVVLWEVQRKSLAIACDHIAQTAAAANAAVSPKVLQLAAGTELSDRERMVLSEFGCSATIRHPEDLPGLARLIHGYFATSGEVLD